MACLCWRECALLHQLRSHSNCNWSSFILQDNLLPMSCKGADWQGGMALTLVDSLDALLLLDRRKDMEVAVEALRSAISFDKDEKVS